MVVPQNVMDALKKIGLNLYERKLFVAILARGTSTAGELSEIAHVPRSRCYDVLESLAEKGLVVIQTGKPLRYVAVQPNEALERARKGVEKKAQDTIKEIENLRKSKEIVELEKLYKDGVKITEPFELTGSIKGKHAMMQQIESMLRTARKSVNIVTTDKSLKALFDGHYSIFKDVNKNGVKIKILTTLSPDSQEAVDAFKKIAQVKEISEPRGRLCLIDGSQGLFALTDEEATHETQEMALWTKSEHLTEKVLAPFFEYIWKKSN